MATEGLLINPEDYLKEIIKLQLKKPKSWNWELTTSKSSPHICLPVIQLFDAKGNLLVEAKDVGAERRSWQNAKNLQKCASVVIVNHKTSHRERKKDTSENRRKDSHRANENQINKQMQHTSERGNAETHEVKNEDMNERKKVMIKQANEKLYKRTNKLENGEDTKIPMDFDSLLKEDKNDPKERHSLKQRRRSDDLFARTMKDGSKRYLQTPESEIHEGNYIYRTSSAGTLLLREESTRKQKRRRRGDPSRHCSDPCGGDNTPGSESDFGLCVVDSIKISRSRNNLVADGGEMDTSRKKRRRPRRKQNDPKARSVKEHVGEVAKDVVGLERLVRRLSGAEDVKMGANVSRHSSKGLSGRRTQSSGSICKGRKNNEGQICGSLPSYLDERDAGCNNNYEKLPLNDVERIPPLGDGAPLHWKFSDNQTVLCDQGYGSERSPEEEYPPPLPEHDNQCNHHLDIHSCYPFITPESTFCVNLAKGSRGLGLSVTGGIDSGGSWPGLIRVKRLFPHQPASACGVLGVGDLILEANGVPLTGLTNYEALEVLRTAPSQVELRICRPPPDVLNCVSPISEIPPPPPRREPPTTLLLTPGQHSSDDDQYNGEFEITMRKMQGSLGFTLRKEDDSALGHYIRALVREPALNDDRIRPGDKIIAVNDVEISSMTHEEAVQFLRKCGDLVKLRLYRDAAQTPVATLSPTETTPRTSFSRKAQLRQEAVDMLNDIAVRKLLPPNQDTYRCPHSPPTSPRRIRSRTSCLSDGSLESTPHYHSLEEQFHEGLLTRGGHLPLDEDSFNSLFIQDDDDGDRPSRPSSLELYNPNQTPVACRKPKFNFSLAHNAYELNNLDAEILDAPNLTYNLGDDVNSTEVECGDSFPKEPASMPHLPTDNPGFSYKNPAYQSAHPPCGHENGNVEQEEPEKKPPRRKKSIKEKKTVPEEPQVLAIELNRGWNSRLGFSLQGPTGGTFVSAVHADSVAARDGRIKAGDQLMKVNDESIEHMPTNEIIDLLRIVRGPVCIVVLRAPPRPPPRDCSKSNAVN